jgi:glycosyltransferase involved in cell wall biosynthesis
MRILYIHSTLVPPPLDPRTDRFVLLSDSLEGDVLQPTWFRSPEQVEAIFGPGSYPVYTAGRFRYHWFLAYQHHGLRRRLAGLWFYIRTAVQLHRENAFDCLVVYSHMTTGLVAAIVKLLTGAKSIVEVATSPDLVYITERPRPTLRDHVMKLYSDVCLHLSLWFSDRAHLLYPAQLDKYPLLRRVRTSVFHEFVSVAVIPAHKEGSERFVLLVGAPWYLKGADRLIEAFRSLAADFPDVKLKIVGHFPDREPLEALTGGSPQIEILKPVRPAEALQIISQCEILVQPSRCEGMGRVLVEAMSAGIPVIGSDVGGIPHILLDGEVGFVVAGGDPGGLEARMRQLLLDGELRRRMGVKGSVFAHTKLSERVYVELFTEMVEAAVLGRD